MYGDLVSVVLFVFPLKKNTEPIENDFRIRRKVLVLLLVRFHALFLCPCLPARKRERPRSTAQPDKARRNRQAPILTA
ncbi:MAG: hypothetical protein HPM95_18165 [Alphaproteobacteria bacterium]|nr:hypothetical protein [Alphaproteobacteria bacterium]